MTANSDTKYFNIPVQLYSGFLLDKKTGLNNIFDYAIHAGTLDLNEGTTEQKGKSASKFLGVTSGNLKKTLANGEQLFDSIPKDSPKVGMNIAIWFDYYKNYKDEFEIVCLLAFLAIKSILKNKPHACITNAYLLARMDGKPCSVKDYTELSPEIFKYANEYQTKKIKRALSDGWGLVTYSQYIHGFYVSFTLSLDELVLIAEKNRKKNKDFKAKREADEARQKALAIIYGTN